MKGLLYYLILFFFLKIKIKSNYSRGAINVDNLIVNANREKQQLL